MRVAIVGCGEFAQHFVPLFQKHPFVQEVFACDLIPQRAQKYSEKFGIEIIENFDKVIAHESAKLGGMPLDVPDFGDAPEEL